MNHSWDKQSDMNTISGNVKCWICRICRCKKTLAYYKFAEPDYQRNGQLYSHYIECVDIEAENLKTID